jgi:hypothetical protein
LPHFDSRFIFNEAGVEVHGYHATLGRDPIAQPTGDRAVASTDLEAPPSRRHTETVESLHGPGVIALLDQS